MDSFEITKLNYDPFGGTEVGSFTSSQLLSQGDGMECGGIAIRTMAGLFQTIRNGDVAVQIHVEDFSTGNDTAVIWGFLDVTQMGGDTKVMFSPGSGRVVATGDSLLCMNAPDQCMPDKFGRSFFDFVFSDDLSTMRYRTGSGEPNIEFNGNYFSRAALYCGNAGEDNHSLKLANIQVNSDGTVLESEMKSEVSDVGLTGITCRAEEPVKADNLIDLRLLIERGLVYFEVETASNEGFSGIVRGQLILNKN